MASTTMYLAIMKYIDTRTLFLSSGSLAVCVIGLILHRLLFHNLAKFPGPITARLTSIPNWYHAKKGDRHEWLYSLHSQYGSCVRFSPDSVSFNTVAAVETIYRSRKSNVIRSDWYESIRDSAGGFESTLTARQEARHAVKRRLLSHAFSDKSLKDYEPRIRRLLGTWLDCLEVEAQNRSQVDLGDWCNFLIFDILIDLGFGAAAGLCRNEGDRLIVELIPKTTGGWYALGYHPLSKLWRALMFKTRFGPYIGGAAYNDNVRFRDYCLSKLMERRKAQSRRKQDNPSGTKDMFEHLLDGEDPETGETFSIGDLACESVLLMVAGSQSTSAGLAAVFFYLVRHPTKLSKLRHEIHDAFASEDDIRYKPGGKLASLPYLRACINESLRLSPPTPGHLPREIIEAEGLVVDGHWLRAGMNVGVAPYAIHRNDLYFEQPTDFNPERWVYDKETTDGMACAFVPFSVGSTGCIGRQLAMMELCLSVASLLWRFDIQAQAASEDPPTEYRMRDCFVGEGSGPTVQLAPCFS